MLQNATSLRKSTPWPPNIFDEHIFCTETAREMHLCRSSSNAPRLPLFLKLPQNPHFWQGAEPTAPARQNNDWRSKSGPNMLCFSIFDFETCFAPQRRALFRHLNLQKCSEAVVPCRFLLPHVIGAAAVFSTSKLPKVLRSWGVLCILISKCASRHDGVHCLNITTSKVLR